MNRSFPKRINWPALLLALLVVCLLGASSSGVRRMFMSPSVVATVDIVRCFNALDERAALEATLNEQIRQMTEESKRIEQQIKDIELDLADLAPGAEAYRQKQGEQLELSRRLKTQVDLTEIHRQRQYSKIVLKLYGNIRAAAESLAKAQDIDLVFVDDTKVEIQPGNEQDISRQISARRMLYVNPEIDVTDEMIGLMNQQYQVANPGPQPRGN